MPSASRRPITSASSAASPGLKRFFLDDAMAVAPEAGQEVLGFAMADGALAQPASVRSGPDAGVIAVAPVGEVVAAFLAGARVIADLIGRDSGFGGALRRQLVKSPLLSSPSSGSNSCFATMEAKRVPGSMVNW